MTEFKPMQTSDPQPGLAWFVFSLMTVISWGVYGVLLHTGQIGMSDPVNGRYKAFLFVGVAYFITAVLAPLGVLGTERRVVEIPSVRHVVVTCRRHRRRDRCVLCPACVRCKGSPAAVMSIVFGGAPIVNAVRRAAHPSTYGRLERIALAIFPRHCAGRDRRLPRHALQAPACKGTSRGGK